MAKHLQNRIQTKKEIASRLVALCPGLEIGETKEGYTPLQVGPGSIKNPITISGNAERVSFLIRNPHLLDQAKSAGLRYELVQASKTKAFRGFQYRFKGITPAIIDEHPELMKSLTVESVTFVEELRRGVKHG